MTRPQIIEAFAALGSRLRSLLSEEDATTLEPLLLAAFSENGWFTKSEVLFALDYWAAQLNQNSLETWLSAYDQPSTVPKTIGLILAGNIPLVGFHDIVSVLLMGHKVSIKYSSTDSVLIKFLLAELIKIEPELASSTHEVQGRLEGFDAVIATGSNNSSRYFEQYFKHVPHVIRKNRTGVAVLNGNESKEELAGLAEDCFRYFGLGCRSVTKLFIPKDYDLNAIFEASLAFTYMMDHKKFSNNYTYHKTLLLMEQREILENGLVVLTESENLYSPVSVLNYEYIQSQEHLDSTIQNSLDDIQCVVGHKNTAFGEAQHPQLNDYADGVDTLKFLEGL